MGNRKYPPISLHETVDSQLKVNWKDDYKNEYCCLHCTKGKLTKFYYQKSTTSKMVLRCNFCNKKVNLTCRVPSYIYNYAPEIECPNPFCQKRGHNQKRGWIYLFPRLKNYKCHFCKITFNPHAKGSNSWINVQKTKKLLPFSYDNDVWDLRHFYSNSFKKSLNFQEIIPKWYRVEIKAYIYYAINSKKFSSEQTLLAITSTLKYFGKIIEEQKINDKFDINRNTVIKFLYSYQHLSNETINRKLYNLRDFFEWLNLDNFYLIRSRDFLKRRVSDADWLDNITRKAINLHLDKIPAPIKRHYLVQSYIAARPKDICFLNFDCLVEKNSKWYVKFYQHKTKRWHKIFATRKIRKVIEEQQEWIRKILGENYSYLFCHFRTIFTKNYPHFFNLKPLPKPPKINTEQNPMVRIIRMLIEKENILDANGQKPHFTGKITRSSRLQEVRTKYGMEAARLYADHKSSNTTFQYYAPPTREQVAEVDLPFQELLMNPDNKFLPWQSLPESLLKNPKAHELDLEIAPRLVVYGHCALDPKTPCPVNLFPKCYGCSSFRPSTGKLPLYERQYQGEQQRLTEAEKVGAELAQEEAKSTIEAMDKWLPELRRLANG